MKVQIAIRGRRYTVRSDEDDIDLQAIAQYVDGRMAEIAKGSTSMDDYTVAMLAALNIAQDFERYRRLVDSELAGIDRDLSSTAAMVQAAMPAESTS